MKVAIVEFTAWTARKVQPPHIRDVLSMRYTQLREQLQTPGFIMVSPNDFKRLAVECGPSWGLQMEKHAGGDPVYTFLRLPIIVVPGLHAPSVIARECIPEWDRLARKA